MVKAATFVLASFFALAAANPVARTLPVHESMPRVPSGFQFTKAADPSAVLNLRFALKNPDIPGLEAAVLAGSTPGSDTYGVHLSVDEVFPFFCLSKVHYSYCFSSDDQLCQAYA
jgi:tripeptidyl-peptidase-1